MDNFVLLTLTTTNQFLAAHNRFLSGHQAKGPETKKGTHESGSKEFRAKRAKHDARRSVAHSPSVFPWTSGGIV
jgi:hypothetical protein